MADMIKDAIAAADNHLKVAQENLVDAQTWLEILIAGDNPVPRPLPKTKVFGLTGVWICLALFISLIVLAQFLRVKSNTQHPRRSDQCQIPPVETIALCSLFLVVSVSAVYLIMVTPVFGLTGVWTSLIIFMSLIGTAGLLRLCEFNKEKAHEQPLELIKPDPNNNEQPLELIKPDSNNNEQPLELIKPDPNNNEQPLELIKPDSNNNEQPLELIQPKPNNNEQPLELIKPDPNNNEQPLELIKPDPNNNEQPLELIKPEQPLEINKENMMTEIKDSIKGLLSFKDRLILTKLDKINKNEVDDIKYAIKAVGLIEEHLTLLKSQNNNYGEHEKKIQDALKPAIDAVQSMKEVIKNGV